MVFGHVISGESVVKKIESQPTDANSRPKAECVIAHCGELVLTKTKKAKRKKVSQICATSSSMYYFNGSFQFRKKEIR